MKLKNSIIILVIMLSNAFLIHGKEHTRDTFLKQFIKPFLETDDVSYPAKLLVDDQRIYVADRKHGRIYVYSKNDRKKIAEFGQRGEGPGDIYGYIRDIRTSNDTIYICTPGRVSTFTINGEFIEEFPVPAFYRSVIPLENKNFAGMRYGYSKADKGLLSINYCLLDQKFKWKKLLFEAFYKIDKPKDNNKTVERFFPDRRKCVLYKNRLYIGCTDRGFYFQVLDTDGNQLYKIDKAFEKIPVTNRIKRKVNSLLKLQMGNDGFKNYLARKEPVFPENIPAYLNFYVGNEKIYVIHFTKPGAKGWMELLIMDLKGNEIAKKLIFLGGLFIQLEMEDYASFNGGKIYFLTMKEESSEILEFNMEAVFTEDGVR